MLVALIAKDKLDSVQTRADNRPAHLDYLKTNSEIVAQAGPLLSNDGDMIGSLIILEVLDMAGAQAFSDNDPYARAGLFSSVTLTQWRRVIG